MRLFLRHTPQTHHKHHQHYHNHYATTTTPEKISFVSAVRGLAPSSGQLAVHALCFDHLRDFTQCGSEQYFVLLCESIHSSGRYLHIVVGDSDCAGDCLGRALPCLGWLRCTLFLYWTSCLGESRVAGRTLVLSTAKSVCVSPLFRVCRDESVRRLHRVWRRMAGRVW